VPRSFLLLLVLLAPLARVHAEEAEPKASEWRSYCQSYLKELSGEPGASDLDVTYCIGMTQGLLNGMRVGSQLGALSMGSLLAVKYEHDPDEVFKLFEAQPKARLLGICSPPAAATRDHVRIVLDHLARKPDDEKRPIAEVMYEALQDAYPCR
jgi:hypothetical protein